MEEVFEWSSVLFDLHVGGQLIRTTHEHPFYVDSKALGKQWLAACALCPGDLLKSHDGRWVAVDSVSDTNEDVTVYNLRIEEYHTYFVGSDEWGFSVLSHNTACGPFKETFGSFEDAVGETSNRGLNQGPFHISPTKQPDLVKGGFTEFWIGQKSDGEWWSAFFHPGEGIWGGGHPSSHL